MRKARCDKDCLNCKHGMCIYDQDEILAATDNYAHMKKLERSRKWDSEHREYNRQRAKAWYQANREVHKAKVLARYWEKKNDALCENKPG